MKYSRLGQTDMMVSQMGIGCSKFGTSMLYDNTDKVEELLQTAVSGGVNFFDMSNVYAFGQTETLLGKILESKRKDLYFATKGGKIPSKLSSFARFAHPLAPFIRQFIKKRAVRIKKEAQRRQNFDPKYLDQELNLSLERLRTSYVDVYQLHSPFLQDLQTPGLFNWLQEQKRIGKCRAIGISVNTIEEAVWIVKNETVDCLQIPFNLLHNEAESLLFPLLVQNKIGIISRVPFAQGLLTSNSQDMNEPFFDLVQNFRKEASKQNLSIEEYALRFCASHPEVDVVLPGTSSPAHLKKNIQAFD